MTSDALIIFAKNPVLGAVKTRLAKSVGKEQALAIYNKLLSWTQRETSQSQADVIVYYASEIIPDDVWGEVEKKKQPEGDLGQKMAFAFQEELLHFQKVCIIGTDCAALTSDIIDEAFRALETHDFVFGPANDGGYYLMGMKRYVPDLFEDMKWSTSTVLSTSIARTKAAGYSHVLLQELVDVDTVEDWTLVKHNFE